MSGIYIHIPFCKQACHYCDFHFSTSFKKKEALLDALTKELILRKDEFKNTVVETIYFGGGTPSVLSVVELQQLLNTIYNNYNVTENPEITLEANPDDLTPDKLEQLSKTQINRLSIGIQSFFNEHLQEMNRAHNANQAKNSLELATQLFNNITIDLIYGMPNMSAEVWAENLEIAFSYNIQHLSSYALTVEPKTALDYFIKNGKYPSVNDDLTYEHFTILVAKAKKAGMVHYEISNFGKPNYFSKHNTSYWQGKPYIGIGPSAHSYNITHRSWNVANNTKYINALTENKLPSTKEKLSVTDEFNEYVLTRLRTIWGVNLQDVTSRFGNDYTEYLLKESSRFIVNELLYIDNDILKTTPKGMFKADGIAAALFRI